MALAELSVPLNFSWSSLRDHSVGLHVFCFLYDPLTFIAVVPRYLIRPKLRSPLDGGIPGLRAHFWITYQSLPVAADGQGEMTSPPSAHNRN
jgi:hypothetical protein